MINSQTNLVIMNLYTSSHMNVIIAFFYKRTSSTSYSILLVAFILIFNQIASTPNVKAQETPTNTMPPINTIRTSNNYFRSETSKSATTTFPPLNIPVENVTANAGTDVRLSCTNSSFYGPVHWIRKSAKGNNLDGNGQPYGFLTNSKDGSIMFPNLNPMQDAGIYTCVVDSTNRKLRAIRLTVKSVPPAVANLSVIPHSVYALVTWQLPGDGDGGYPILRFVLSYRLDKSHLSIHGVNTSSPRDNKELIGGTPTYFSMSGIMPDMPGMFGISASIPQEEYEWRVIDDDISPNATSKSVYNLRPNTTYYFRLFAVNKLGNGHDVSVEVNTKYSIEEINQAIKLLSEKGMTSLYIKILIIVIIVIIVTFAILGLGISLVVFRSCGCAKTGGLRTDGITCEAIEDDEAMELVPHITLNPSFNIDMLEYIEAEESPTSDLQYVLPPSGMAAAAVGTTASLRAAASKAVSVASAAPAGSSGMRKSSVVAEDKVNLVERTTVDSRCELSNG